MVKKILKNTLKIIGVIFVISLIALSILCYWWKDQGEVLDAVSRNDRQTISYYIDEREFNPNDLIMEMNLIQYYIATNRENTDVEFIKFLIDRGINPNIYGEKWSGPLSMAVFFSYYDIVNFLLDNGADVNRLNGKSQKTVLTVAIVNKDCEVAKLLIDKGFDFEKVNLEQWEKDVLEECEYNNWISSEKYELK